MSETFSQRTPGDRSIQDLPSTDHITDAAIPPDCCLPASFDRLLSTPHFSHLNNDYSSIPLSFDGGEEWCGRAEFIIELPDCPKKSVIRNRSRSCENSPTLINFVPLDELVGKTTPASPMKLPSLRLSLPSAGAPVSMSYNEYGELVNIEKLQQSPIQSEMNCTDILRVINKTYRHKIRDKMEEIILEEMDGKESLIANDRPMKEHHLSSWVFENPPPPNAGFLTPDPSQHPKNSPLRVLELGCGSGSWCFLTKEENPSWIVHGVDDSSHWLCVHNELAMRDSLTPAGFQKEEEDYFSSLEPSDSSPQFSVRNYNSLLNHVQPMPISSYGLIRGRQIFHKIEDYMNFLDSVRSILQPSGVVEFLELDPRPRTPFVGPLARYAASCKTEATTDWPGNIAVRLEDPVDCQDLVPGWSARVEEALKATLRPLDGIPAANLKTWLEASGFYDVKESIFPVPIGGNTTGGQKLRDLLLYQLDLENSIPKLKAELPKVEMDDLMSGVYHLNFHIVTGRKPQFPRTGDLLPDGTRNSMTPSTYAAMARSHHNKALQWKRLSNHLDLNSEASEIMKTLKMIRVEGGA